MPRTEKETTFQGILYCERERDGTRKRVATVEDGAENIEIAAYPAGSVTAGSLQATIEALAARIEALENA